MVPTFPRSNGREGSRRIHRSTVHITSLLRSSGVLVLLCLYSPLAVNAGLTTSDMTIVDGSRASSDLRPIVTSGLWDFRGLPPL
jgi:hypothetical protein